MPGCTVVCGDSHTSTHGAFGALAFGIGTSEVEHVLATQTLLQKKSKNMLIRVNGSLLPGVQSKDVILHIISKIGTAGGTGYVIEFAGSLIESLTMEARMSICNMSIEAGARAGLIAPDEITFDYLKNRPLCPKSDIWLKAVEYWKTLKSDKDSTYDKTIEIDAKDILPNVTWGTSPEDSLPIDGVVPNPADYKNEHQRKGVEVSLEYMGLTPGMKLTDIKIDKVFIGSCTNGRIEDLRSVAAICKNKKVNPSVYAMIVPGSGLVKKQAEEEGLADIFIKSGFDWREAGCSMCLGMNEDQLKPFERCASTSNRNFQGRQGFRGRTHLMSPAMAACAALKGYLADVREFSLVPLGTKIDSKSYVTPLSESDYKKAEVIVPKISSKTDGKTNLVGMEPFTILKGRAAPMPLSNIDTDKIIPKQFLKTITRTGLGKALFYEMRYNDDVPNPDFVLNKAEYSDSVILVAGANFGCGSSREHAPWALLDFGIRSIIAPSFADIFESNCTKNGMLPVTLDQSQIDILIQKAQDLKPIKVDLKEQQVECDGQAFRFEIDPLRKFCLLNGFDDIGLTLQKVDLISKFEELRTHQYPWLDGERYVGTVAPAGIVDW